MGSASRRKAERRAAAQGVTGPYWHGGAPGRKVGDIRLSRRAAEAQHGVSTTHGLQKGYAFGITDPDRVYFSRRRDFARSFAARQITSDRESGIIFQRGSLYRVEPIGAVEPDPDFSMHDVSWCAPAARVTAIEEDEVIMSIFDSAAHAGPFMAWTDMTPMYTDEGFLLPSVPMREQGITAAELRVVYPPWTPHELLDAELRHLPDPTRHGPTDFPDVLMRAADSVIVWRRHRLRQSALLDAGTALRIAEHSDYDAVNALLGAELVRPVTPGDPRRVVVAVDAASGRVVGAVVATLSGNGGRNIGFIDAIAVDPAHQHAGIGSALLITVLQLLPGVPLMAAGQTLPPTAPFFAQAGFTVLRPDVPLFIPMADTTYKLPTEPGHAWFYKQDRW
ncbi:GNAT family N-acetyltransferase [Clavibacter michiganensis]|uniref:GNAT family N-acetyltransferase n=1 Tax=Clavibacter michiganensis TaxID=28447 RepID=UPI002930629A|nr:GNAT family N-acetyltransferase [Clavibacter michiganensis]